MNKSYFLGGASANGFKTDFHDIMSEKGMHSYILKGGPGTGKSTLMRKIAEKFSEYEQELYFCSSDTRSIDAVVIKKLGVLIVDGTAPHVFNADRPGISETIKDLGVCWDKEMLTKDDGKIRDTFKRNSAYHTRARHLIKSLSAVNDSIYDLACDNFISGNIKAAAKELTKDFKNKTQGSIKKRTISAITADGYSSRDAGDYKTIAIEDDYFVASFEIMEEIKNILFERNHDIIISHCNLFSENKIEHIEVPDEKIRFSVKNRLNKINNLSVEKKYECSEFYSSGDINDEFVSAFSLIDTLENMIAYSIKKALDIHDELESFYIKAMDFDKLNKITENLIAEISE